ncbi:MAG: HNH endonuclease, partial [Mycobacterium sp.]
TGNWRDGAHTDITDQALACGPDNRLADTGGWHTTMENGRAHWTPPPLLDVGQPRTNQYHHPTLYPIEGDSDDEKDSPTN